MLERFYPDVYLDSAYEIDYEGLYKQGYRGVIFDVDNTLVPHGAPADERSIALFERLRSIGYESMLRLIENGAQVLHDRSVELAREYGITVEVLSAFTGLPGTLVGPE